MTKEQFIEITEWFRQVDGRIHPADHLDELYNLSKDLKDFVILPDYPHQTEMKRAVFGASFIAMFRIADACGFTYEEILGLISERHRKVKQDKEAVIYVNEDVRGPDSKVFLIKTFGLDCRKIPGDILARLEWAAEINGKITTAPQIMESIMKSGYFVDKEEVRIFVSKTPFSCFLPLLAD